MITVIGVGRVGSDAALHLGLRKLDREIMLIDVVQGLPQGEALDLNHTMSILGIDVEYRGSNDYRDMAGSELVIVTAGLARKPGMTREELAAKNAEIVNAIGRAIKEHAPNAIVLMTTNPLDAMVYVMYRATGFPRERVIGFSGVLDSGRLAYYASRRIGVSPSSILPIVVGQHGEKMVPLPRHTYVYGKPITEFLSRSEIDEVVKETIQAGAEITKLRGYSSNHAPGAGVAVMAEAIKRDEKKVFLASAILKGEYGVEGVPACVPLVLGKTGIERIIELDMTEEEKRLFEESINAIRENIGQIPKSLIE